MDLDQQIQQHAAAMAAGEQQARSLDDKFSQIPGVPSGWLKGRRSLGQIRNPYGVEHNNISVQDALAKWPGMEATINFLKAQAGIAPAAPDYQAIAQKEENARLDQQMADWVAASQAARAAAGDVTEQLKRVKVTYGGQVVAR